MDLLVSRGCDVNHVDSNEQTPIFYASREGHTEVCKRLVQSFAANPDACDKNGQTPLYYAVRAGKLETAEFLIKHCGTNVNHEDKKSQTPLHIAKNNNKTALMNLLLAFGAKPLEDLRRQ